MILTNFDPCKNPENKIGLRRLESIKDYTNPQTKSIDSIFFINRFDQEDKSVATTSDTRCLYKKRSDLTLAFEQYALVVILNRDHAEHYKLDHPILWYPVQAEYGGIINRSRLGPNGRIYQNPLDLILRPEEPDVVEYMRDSLMLAQANVIEKITGIKPVTWLSREGLPQGNYTNEWPIEELAIRVEAQKLLYEGEFNPDLDITHRAVRGKLKRRDSITAEVPVPSPTLGVLILLERRALGLEKIQAAA